MSTNNIKRPKTTLVLVEPSGPINLGSVARLCENYGIRDLRIVKPRCNHLSAEALMMAVRGEKILKEARKFSCLIDAIADCRKVIATCGRKEHGEIPLHTLDESLPWAINSKGAEPVALVFGREDRGLSNKELQLAQRVITINPDNSYQSLNLSHAVAIVLYELNRYQKPIYLEKNLITSSRIPATSLQLNSCLEDTEKLLLDVGFLLKHTANARMAKIQGLINRAEITQEEISMIRGIIRQLNWALEKRNTNLN